MATNKNDKTTKKVSNTKQNASPQLKKRTLPTSTAKSDAKKPVLEKRTSPDVKQTLNTRTSPLDEKEVKSTKGIDIFSKKVTDEVPTEKKEKTALEKMRERISAQKRLEQDVMAQQALKNQEKDAMRAKLSSLSKDIDEVEKKEKIKINPDFDLKADALEAQNNKLKKDLEKSKQQLDALLALEFHNLKVLDQNSLTLSDEFVESINSIKELADANTLKEEQSLKDELGQLQKEISTLKAKNIEARKASEDAAKVATLAQKAVNKAKKAIAEQESDEVRDFKSEISVLEQKLKDTQKELLQVQEQNIRIKEDSDKLLLETKNTLEARAQQLDLRIKELEQELSDSKALEERLKEEIASLSKENDSKIVALNKELENAKQNAEEEISHLNLLLEEKRDGSPNNELIDSLNKKIEELRTFKVQLDLANEKISSLNEELEKASELKSINSEITSKNEELEKQLSEQNSKIEEIVFSYQQELASKNEQIKEKDLKIKAFGENGNLSSDDINSNLEEQCNQYKELLLSERNSHLQVEQKLCSDLDNYKLEIAKLQQQLANISSEAGIARLNKQVSTIEEFITDLKNNPQAPVNRDVYSEYYEKMISEYKNQEDFYLQAIEKRNKMLVILRDEKLNIIEILKASSKNSSLIEKQVEDINSILNEKIKANDYVDSSKIEAEILSTVKDELVKYCDNLKQEALDTMTIVNEKYNNAATTNSLIESYNQDCKDMAMKYGDEIAKLNLELELTRDQSSTDSIEQKVLLIEKQYRLMVRERDRKFSEAMERLKSGSEEDDAIDVKDGYFAFVGEEYNKSINQYEIMKENLEKRLEEEKTIFDEANKKLIVSQNDFLNKIKDIKQEISKLNALPETEETNLNKKELSIQLQQYEIKLDDLKQYGFEELEETYNNNVQAIQKQYADIINEENKLRDSYMKREQAAKNSLEREKELEVHADANNVKQNISEYIYIEEEGERVIESIQERRLRLTKVDDMTDENAPIMSSGMIQQELELEEVENENDVAVIKKPNISKDFFIVKEVVKDDNPTQVISIVNNESQVKSTHLQRAKEMKIKNLTEEINTLNYDLGDFKDKKVELDDLNKRYSEAEAKLAKDFRDVRKYKSFLIQYLALKDENNKVTDQLTKLNPVEQRKQFKSKQAELKSINHKINYFLKQMKSYNNNKHVNEYTQLVDKLDEIKETILKYDNKINDLIDLIDKKKAEIESINK